MLVTNENLIKILSIVRFELYNKESVYLISTHLLKETLIILQKKI